MLPRTSRRVPEHTAGHINEAIRREAEARVRFFADNPALIGRRLDELDEEWDVERVLEANAASITLIGLGLASGVDRRWIMLPAAVAAFLLQHALQGWCPPVPVFRRLGYRTAAEIQSERYMLKALRGDFDQVGDAEDRAASAMRAVRA